MTSISATVDWVKDICWMNLVSVAQQKNKLYYVGGYSFLRSTSTPTRGGTMLANSHLYAADFTNSVDLVKNSSAVFTSVTRLPDLVPRISSGNLLWRESSLNLFGGAQATPPIFLPNGSFSLADRVTIGDSLFRDDISDGNSWTRNSSFDYGGTQKTPIGSPARAFDGHSDDGKGVLWFYGGGYWEYRYKVGMELKGTDLDVVGFEDLWRIPGDCDPDNVVACKQNTTTLGDATIPRGNLDGTMVWVDNGAKGLLVLFGGSFRGTVVSMKNVHVYDIATSKWYTQPTTADNDTFPSDRTSACAVAATAPDRSSYNIYLHGGYTNRTTNGIVNGGIWILTLPTFHWIHSPIGQEHTKAEHTCAKIHDKFMVVHRGVGVLGDSNCDENAGLTIVDLVTLEWVTKIDVSGGDVVYQVPELVSKAIGGQGTGGATYNSPKNGFADETLYNIFNITSPSPFTTNHNTTNTTIPTTTPTSSPSSSPSSVPKIAGGVLGGLVLVIIILSGMLLFLRRRHRKLEAASPLELPGGSGARVEMAAHEAPAMELAGAHWVAELPSGGAAKGEEKKDSPMGGDGQYYAPTQMGPA